MRAPWLRNFPESSNSWLTRMGENLGHLVRPAGLQTSSANRAPIHLLKFEKSGRIRKAQTVSFVIHGALVAAMGLALAHPPVNRLEPSGSPVPTISVYPWHMLRGFATHPAEGSGSGGDQNPIPPTGGHLPRLSAMPLLKPSLRQGPRSELLVPPTLLDASTPSILRADKLGLPWMPEETNSPGPARGHTMGSSDGNRLGDGGTGQAGEGGAGDYWPGGTLPSCAYCPLPLYTDEARQVKMQGTVTLRVLVAADGRASDIRVLRGIGYGLVERATETVRGWKFTPARDARHHPAVAWVIVEVAFRLF
jgi:TonB family protein